MFRLLVLSLVLSAPSAAAPAAVVPGDAVTDPYPPLVLVRPGVPRIVDEPQSEAFDPMEIHPESDICYKIRAYVFSTGPVPKLLRETTCGPKRATSKRVEGAKPKLVPIDADEKPAPTPER